MDTVQLVTIAAAVIATVGGLGSIIFWSHRKLEARLDKNDERLDKQEVRLDNLYNVIIDMLRDKKVKKG